VHLDSKARFHGLLACIGCHFGAIKVQFPSPDESGFLALFHDLLKEAAEDIEAIALTNARQTGMVGQGLIQIVTNIPTNAEPICSMPHELPWRRVSPRKTARVAA
jgi:hypothetical protein